MKLRKRKLFSSIAFMLSLVMLAVSGAVFVHTATQQSATSTLQVTYDARNVNFTAQAWYEKPSNSGTKQAFSGNTLTVNATTAESTTNTLSVTDPITLDATTDTYTLFTYKFVNTASSGGYDMLVSLTDDATKTNVKVKYLTSITSNVYTTLSEQKGDVEDDGSTSVPAAVCVPAQSTLYYYVLVEIDDNTLGSSYTGDSTHKITWSITSANTKGATMYSVCFDANGGSGSMPSQSYTSGTQQALTTNSLTKEGYTFAGWNTAADGTGTSYTNEQALTLTSLSNGAQIVLYAQWEVPSYTVTISVSSSVSYSGLSYQLAEQGVNAAQDISSNPSNPNIYQSNSWTVFSSSSFTINGAQRVFIAINWGWSKGYLYCNVQDTSADGEVLCRMKTDYSSRYNTNGYEYYFDSGDLTQNVTYYISYWQEIGGNG